MTLGMIQCLRCGNPNMNYAQFCAGCGAQFQVNLTRGGNGRAIIALVLGIAGLFFCGFTAIPGTILAWMEMQAVRAGRAPQTNGGMAKIAFWINLVALVFTVIAVLLMLLFGIALV